MAIKSIGNGNFYRTLAERQIAKVAERNRTSFDMGRIILENNKRLCNEINEFNKVKNSNGVVTYLVDSVGQIIKKVESGNIDFLRQVSDAEIIKLIEKMRAIK